MNQTEFKNKLNRKINNKDSHLDNDIIDECHNRYLNYHKVVNEDEILVIPMEEMAELTQHLSKILRKKENKDNIGLLEELADVQICIDNLKKYFEIDEEIFKYAMDVKFERIYEKIKKGTA